MDRLPNIGHRLRRRFFPSQLERILAIPGWTSAAQLSYLMTLVSALRDQSAIVEVGTWQGRSALALAEACRGTRKHVFAVDPWDDYVQAGQAVSERLHEWRVRSFEDNYSAFRRNIQKLELGLWITPVRLTSVAAAHNWAHGPVSLVFIDGNHDYAAVTADLIAWTHRVQQGGRVCGDDWNWEEVQRAVVDFTSSAKLDLELPCENTWAFIKR